MAFTKDCFSLKVNGNSKNFITVADNSISGDEVEKNILNYLHQSKTGMQQLAVQAALEMWENVGSANSVALTDASVRVDCVCL